MCVCVCVCVCVYLDRWMCAHVPIYTPMSVLKDKDSSEFIIKVFI